MLMLLAASAAVVEGICDGDVRIPAARREWSGNQSDLNCKRTCCSKIVR